MKQHVNYIDALSLFLNRFGTDAEAFDEDSGVWIDAEGIEALRRRALENAYVSGCHGGHGRGGGYITEARPCYLKFGKQYAVAVTMECSAPGLLPTLTMYWLTSEPPTP